MKTANTQQQQKIFDYITVVGTAAENTLKKE